MSLELTNLRQALRETFFELLDQGNPSNAEVISEFKIRHSNLIKAAQKELETVALKRILNDIAVKKTKLPSMIGQGDLFGDVSLPKTVSLKTEDGQLVRSKFESLSIEQLKRIHSIGRKSPGEGQRKQILDFLEKLENEIGSGRLTVKEALAKIEKRNRKKKK